MSDVAEIQDKPQHQKSQGDKGTILTYFKKKDPVVKSKSIETIEDKPNISKEGGNFEDVAKWGENKDGNKRFKENEEVVIEEELKNETSNTEDSDDFVIITEKTPIKNFQEAAVIGKTCNASEATHSSAEDSGSDEESGFAKKSLTTSTKSDNVKNKSKNIFAFMMANRDKQNEVVKAMAENDEANQQVPSDESRKYGETSKIKEAKTPEKSEVKAKRGEGSKLSKNYKAKIVLEDDKSPLKETMRKVKRESRDQQKKHDENREQTKHKKNREQLKKHDENREQQKKHVKNKEQQQKREPEIAGRCASPSNVGDTANRKQMEKRETTDREKGETVAESGSMEVEIVDLSSHEIPSEWIESVGRGDYSAKCETRTSLSSASSIIVITSPVKKTPVDSKNNAFTLLMTNRYKMNKVSLETKSSESADDSIDSADSKPRRREGKGAEKSIVLQTGIKRRKRKRSNQSQDLESSLCDFDVSPVKKNGKSGQVKRRRRKRRRIVEEVDSSGSEEGEQNVWDELSFDNNAAELSSDESAVDDDDETDRKVRSKSEVLNEPTVDDDKSEESEETGSTGMECETEEKREVIGNNIKINKDSTPILNVEGEECDGNKEEIEIKSEFNHSAVEDNVKESSHESEDKVLSQEEHESVSKIKGKDSLDDESGRTFSKKEREIKNKSGVMDATITGLEKPSISSSSETILREKEVTSNPSTITGAEKDEDNLTKQLRKTRKLKPSDRNIALRSAWNKKIGKTKRNVTKECSEESDDFEMNEKDEPVNLESEEPVKSKPVRLESEKPVKSKPVKLKAEKPVKSKPVKLESKKPIKSKPGELISEKPVKSKPVKLETKEFVESESEESKCFEEKEKVVNLKSNEDKPGVSKPPKKKRKKLDYIESDDEEDKDYSPESTLDEKGNQGDNHKAKGDTSDTSKKGNISSFFKKMSKEEKSVERSKNIMTVKADVHAPCEGLTRDNKDKASPAVKVNGSEAGDMLQGKQRPQVRRSTRRMTKELEDFNKIELLEQIMINSPKKMPPSEQKLHEKPDGGKMKARNENDGGLKNKPDPQTEPEKGSSINEKPKGKNLNEILKDVKKPPSKVSQVKKKQAKKSASTLAKSSCMAALVLDSEVATEGKIGEHSVEESSKSGPHGEKVLKMKPLGKKARANLTASKIRKAESTVGKGHRNKVGRNKSKKLRARAEKKSTDERLSETESPAKESVNESEKSSDNEIFVRKKKTPVPGKQLATHESAAEAVKEVIEDKENIEKDNQLDQKPKKPRIIESAAGLSVGSAFHSFDDWKKQFEILLEEENGALRQHDSRTVAGATKKSGNKILNPSLKYAFLSYKCVLGSSKTKLQLKRQEESTVDCPWKLRLSTSANGQTLVIKEICLDHNHEPIKDEIKTPAKGSQRNSSDCPDTADSVTSVRKLTPLKNSTVQNRLTPPITPNPKRKELSGSRKGAGRKSLGSKENIKSQVKAVVKTTRTNGKVKKKSPKGKRKKLGLNMKKIVALSDDVIRDMAKANVVQVNSAVVDENVINVDSDSSSEDRAKKSLQKKIKISPLVLKPPSKDQKPLKVRGRKKKAKEQLEEKAKSKKKSKAEENTKVILRRTPRQAAVRLKKMFQEMSEDDSSDSEIEVESCSSTNAKKRSAIKSKCLKSEKPKAKNSGGKEEKLAPIFCKRPKSPEIEILKTTLSPMKLKARNDFLQSGVPEQLKKQQLIEKCQEELTASVSFPKVSHVQQKNINDPVWNLELPEILLKDDDEDASPVAVPCGFVFQPKIISQVREGTPKTSLVESPLLDLNSVVAILTALKRRNPGFPVFSVFKFYVDLKKEAVKSYKRELGKETKTSCIDLVEDEEIKGPGKRKRRSKDGPAKRSRKLRTSKGKGRKSIEVETEDAEEQTPGLPIWHERIPDVWTQVYAPRNSKQIIGNSGHIKKLKGWLQDWKSKWEMYVAEEKNKKPKGSKKGDDFVVDDSDSWEDGFVSTYMLCGPPGIGKTACVYALANELGYKVLEVNASSRRPGKQVMSQLAEATQSHSVSNSSGQPNNNAMAAFFAAKSNVPSKVVTKKAGVNVEVSQGSNKDSEKRKGVSLVLFEDIDIVFEESDEGFLSTVNNFMMTTKRPIILTISHLSHLALSKIKGKYELLHFEPPPEDLIARHLQLICLVNGQHACQEDLEVLVNVNHCDIRQSLLDAQIWINSSSSLSRCRCIVKTSKNEAESHQVCVKDIPLSDIFPESVKSDPQDVELYRTSLWGKVHSIYIDLEEPNVETETQESRFLCCNTQSVVWSQFAANLPFFLPFPCREKKQSKKYPLELDDPSVKTTFLWQKYNWLSIDDEEDDVPLSATPIEREIKEKEEEEEEKEMQEPVPKSIIESSKRCVDSMAKLFDTFAQLDVLDSHNFTTPPGKEKRDNGWWMQHPTAGLSDLEGDYVHWAPHGVIPEIVQEIGQRAGRLCCQETRGVLEGVAAKDWEQLSLPIQDCEKPSILESQPSANERLLLDKQAINQHIISSVPLVQQFHRGCYMDYLSFVRSIVRHDELSAVVNKNRRGRRFLSHTAQFGIDIPAEDKIKLANSLLT